MYPITFYLSFIPILGLILLSLNLIFAPHTPYQEKSSTFECGFHSFLGQNRTQFTISFFIFGILFLVFDIELLQILPLTVSFYNNNIYGLSTVLIFFIILTIGFAFELGKNALSIDSKQYNNNAIVQSNIFYIDFVNYIKILLNSIKISLINYKNKFSIIKLIVWAICLTLTSYFLAYILYKLNFINWSTIPIASSYLIKIFIGAILFFIPWNQKMVNALTALLLNRIVIFSIIITISIICANDIENSYIICSKLLLFSVFTTDIIIFEDNFGESMVYMNPGPSNQPPTPGPFNQPPAPGPFDEPSKYPPASSKDEREQTVYLSRPPVDPWEKVDLWKSNFCKMWNGYIDEPGRKHHIMMENQRNMGISTETNNFIKYAISEKLFTRTPDLNVTEKVCLEEIEEKANTPLGLHRIDHSPLGIVENMRVINNFVYIVSIFVDQDINKAETGTLYRGFPCETPELKPPHYFKALPAETQRAPIAAANERPPLPPSKYYYPPSYKVELPPSKSNAPGSDKKSLEPRNR